MSDTGRPKLSVVICFKDWGLERLEGATRSVLMSGLGNEVEVIISDYGSANSNGYRERLEALGAKYFYFETNGVWSRSRALNLGIKQACGDFIVTTDADMVFSPTTFPALLTMIEANPLASYILQCRDLPEGIDHEYLLSRQVDWGEVENKSKLRPRWGMGGLIAFRRSAYSEIRGLDERFEIYGGEDLDLAKRLVRAGYKRVWIDDPRVRMYHVWHPSSRAMANETPEGRAAILRNTSIHKSDVSVVRNLDSWKGRPAKNDPLVTVAISTFNRSRYILESIRSVQAQTFQDWELVVVNDGSTDDTAEALKSLTDPRIRVYNRENAGLAAARNFITSVARGKYIAVHDDDDLMLPTRLEDELAALKPGSNGSFGAWVNFSNETGELEYQSGKAFSLESILFNSGVYLHPTLMVEKSVLSAVPYNETMRSGSDYNLAVRIARAGVKLEHCGKIVMLRRQHDAQITNSHGELQKVSGRVSGNMGRGLMLGYDKRVVREARSTEDAVKVEKPTDLVKGLGPYLPDHLVELREASITVDIDSLTTDQESFLSSSSFDLSATLTQGSAKIGLFSFASLSLEGLNELFARFGSSVTVSDISSQSRNENAEIEHQSSLAKLFERRLVWGECSKLLAPGVYVVVEKTDDHEALKGDEIGLQVRMQSAGDKFHWQFSKINDVEQLSDLTPEIFGEFKGLIESEKISYIQKD